MRQKKKAVSTNFLIIAALAAMLLAIPAMVLCISHDDMQAISALNQNLRSNALNDPETFPW